MWYLKFQLIPYDNSLKTDCWIDVQSLGEQNKQLREVVNIHTENAIGAYVDAWIDCNDLIEAESVAKEKLLFNNWKVLTCEERLEIKYDELLDIPVSESYRYKMAIENKYFFEFHPYTLYDHNQLPF